MADQLSPLLAKLHGICFICKFLLHTFPLSLCACSIICLQPRRTNCRFSDMKMSASLLHVIHWLLILSLLRYIRLIMKTSSKAQICMYSWFWNWRSASDACDISAFIVKPSYIQTHWVFASTLADWKFKTSPYSIIWKINQKNGLKNNSCHSTEVIQNNN